MSDNETTTGPDGHAIVKTWQVSPQLQVLLEDSGNIVLRRFRLAGGDVDTTITNVAALADALYMAAAERGVREAREVLDR
jgi:hypothetical protein